ncbi:MAG TPA: hypothetical protein EYP56_16095 [Planctomycetaceae bacterium]|nr:hypothetical protein [Planctomycetaceae bacterium]
MLLPAFLGFVAADGGAGSYDQSLEVDEEQRKQRNVVLGVLRNRTMQAGDDVKLRTYYETYALSRWTVMDNLPRLATFRRELQNDLNQGRTGPAHDFLVQLVLDFMRRELKKNRPPTFRYNAMLTIGSLNQVDAMSSAQPVVPLPEALDDLLGALADPQESDAVKVAALLGLLRHARLARGSSTGIGDPQVRDQQVIPAMLQLIASPQPPDRTAAGHAWIRALAVDLLAALGQPGAQGEVIKALAALVAEDPGHPLVKETAARALAQFDLAAVSGLDPKELAVTLTQMAIQICDKELQRYEKEKRRGTTPATVAGSGYMGGMMMSGGEGEAEMGYPMEFGEGMEEGSEMFSGGYGLFGTQTTQRSSIQRRRVGALLDAALTGLVGSKLRGRQLKPSDPNRSPTGKPIQYEGVGAADAARPIVRDVAVQIDELLAVLLSEKSDDEVIERMQTAKSKLEKLIQAGATPAAAQTSGGTSTG